MTGLHRTPAPHRAVRPRARRLRSASALVGVLVVALGLSTTAAVAASRTAGTAATGPVAGIDVASYQGEPSWSAVAASGQRFAYVKATEGTGYRNPRFTQQYNGSYQAGLIRGAYHFALPDRSGAVAQADWFVEHGGGWSADGRTLPPALDIEYNPYGATCYGLSDAGMSAWIRAFSDRVQARTGRYPVIYTTTDWWQTCTGDNGSFGATNPLWLARYASSRGTLPAGWSFHTFWQYSGSGSVPGVSGPVDRNVFNGSYDRLQALANG